MGFNCLCTTPIIQCLLCCLSWNTLPSSITTSPLFRSIFSGQPPFFQNQTCSYCDQGPIQFWVISPHPILGNISTMCRNLIKKLKKLKKQLESLWFMVVIAQIEWEIKGINGFNLKLDDFSFKSCFDPKIPVDSGWGEEIKEIYEKEKNYTSIRSLHSTLLGLLAETPTTWDASNFLNVICMCLGQRRVPLCVGAKE